MNILIASDHAGFDHKKYLIDNLSKKYKITDLGTNTKLSCDYPDLAHKLCMNFLNKKYLIGILLCSTGQGMSITSNRYKQIRCAICWNEDITILSRKHNNANVISLPCKYLSFEKSLELVKLFINTSFEYGRHKIRVEKIDIL